jgi:hypothetical protein
MNGRFEEVEPSTAKHEVFCCPHELREMWNGKRELVLELNVKLLEAGGEPTNKRFFI